MAELFLDRDHLDLVLGPVERVGALRGGMRIPLDRIREVRVSEQPFAAIRGLRAPGTAIPGVVALGTWRSRRHGRSFVAAYRGRPALVIEFDGGSVDRVIVSIDDAAQLRDRIAPSA
jgi:hypothetical protein